MNPCLDLSLEFPSLKVGSHNVYTSFREDYCSKGINVSIALKSLGVETQCAGINFRGNGAKLQERMDSLSIPCRFAMADGDIRLNIKVNDRSKNQMTELNSLGVAVPDEVIEDCIRLTVECAAQSSILVMSGRAALGAGADVYRRVAEAVSGYPVKVVVDAADELMREAIKAGPYLIKPNTFELETTFGCTIHTKEDVVKACRKIIAGGVPVVCVSMGGDGAMIVDADSAYFAPTLDLEVKGFQGAGDSVVAGICLALQKGQDIREMLRCGVAAASASLIREGTLLCQRPDFERFLDEVQIQSI